MTLREREAVLLGRGLKPLEAKALAIAEEYGRFEDYDFLADAILQAFQELALQYQNSQGTVAELTKAVEWCHATHCAGATVFCSPG